MCLEAPQAAEVLTNPVTMICLTTDVLKVQARPTHVILATATSDAALHIVRSIADRCGFEAWRRPCLRYEPAIGSKSLALWNKVMEPDFHGGEFIDKFQIWENDTAKESAATKEVLGDRILMKTLTPSLRAQVQFNLGATPTYGGVRNSLVKHRDTMLLTMTPWRSIPWTRAK